MVATKLCAWPNQLGLSVIGSFADENYIASAQALEDSVICVIDRTVLLEILKMNAELTLHILRSVATELGFSNNRTVTLTQKHIRGRLAESLIFLRDTYGFEDDGQTIKVYLSRVDLPTYLT